MYIVMSKDVKINLLVSLVYKHEYNFCIFMYKLILIFTIELQLRLPELYFRPSIKCQTQVIRLSFGQSHLVVASNPACANLVLVVVASAISICSQYNELGSFFKSFARQTQFIQYNNVLQFLFHITMFACSNLSVESHKCSICHNFTYHNI